MFKRFTAASFLLASLVVTALPSAALAQQMVSISKTEANMRTGPGTHHAVSWSLVKGFPLQVVSRKGNWLQVRDFENDRGWVFRSLTGSSPHHIVKANVANLRSEPTTRSQVAGKLVYGEVVTTLDKRPGWVKVQRDTGVKGWVSDNLLWGW
ncbi:peptide-binding protein [Comamonas serinivorans]|uniref:Peptide-binding protein n=1 Tax=Comamonas serinivorans TaxID=1082851 RepID=A0A1Y0ERC1_9BURK|nr:SH3 domain-containing protein [Comamonas serinivorans]ARU05802.1 peptide-binding protein [Comamonas serinivorans]